MPAAMTLPRKLRMRQFSICTSQATVIALVMVRVPKPPESTQLISPPALVAAMAAAKVLQGAARLQVGLRSSPTPETQVRGFCACAGAAARNGNASAMMASESAALRMMVLPRIDRLAIGSGSNPIQTVNNRRLATSQRPYNRAATGRARPGRLQGRLRTAVDKCRL